ncbi:uncharacterized protein LOC136079481 [Hydra vulgaris]|uniref:Uncharacterized protein LOC136079481 n=1 Tax=Hydra vulgaris TaxID=6087 RepID=A0ABM4BQ70_HYDVU
MTKRGSHQVGAITSAEHGNLVTVACAVNDLENYKLPMFVFSRIRYQDHFVRDGPVGSIGAGNSSGWMQEDEFLIFFKHFQKYTSSSKDRKILLHLDNHSSHISIRALNYCSENGIVVLSFSPHCSHKFQPLDRSVYGPFKKAVYSTSDAWMRNNPGKTMTIHNIPSIVQTALPIAFTSTNIHAGFRCAGIYPYNRQVSTDLDFAPSFVTDRLMPEDRPIL